LKKVPAQHHSKPNEQQHHTPSQNDGDKKSKKRNILEVISFKKSPSITSKESKKHQQRNETTPTRNLEHVEIAHLETLKVQIFILKQ
jgi:hypothetical protein